MDSNSVLVEVLFLALTGWLATCYWLITSRRFKLRTRRFFVIPLWFGWMLLALGGPVVQETIPLTQALSTGIGLTTGMLFVILVYQLNRRRSR